MVPITAKSVYRLASDSFDDVLNETIGNKKAIVLIYVNPPTLVKFLKAAYRKNFGNGEYVFVNVLPFSKFPYQFEKGRYQRSGRGITPL